jgi:cysteine-rich repeat protein
MSKRIGTLAFALALGVFATAWLSGAAQAGPASVCCDGVVEGNETCDPDTTCPPVSGDGCSDECLIELCGDDVLTPDTEECDDGNTADGDGCAGDCTCEPEVCGDGIVGCTEECDDGNTVDDETCLADCTLPSVTPVAQTKKQQGCINAINKNLAGVVKAQFADNATCVKDVSNGKQPTFATCYGTDLKQKVSKAQGKVTTTNGKKCNDTEEVPNYAYTDPTTVGAAGEDEVIESTNSVLGAAPTIILKADKAGAKCQQEIMKHLGAIGNKWAAEANKAKKNALKGTSSVTQITTPAELATAIDAATATNSKITAAENKANAGIAKKCDDTQAAAAADCGGATTANQVTLCVIAAAKEAACNALEVADGLTLNCPTVPVIP